MKVNSSLSLLAIEHLIQNSPVELSQTKWGVPQLLNSNMESEKSSLSNSKTVSIRAIVSEYHLYLQEHPLTKRELEILELIVQGDTNSEIAEKLYLTVGTVKTHLRNIFNKLNVNDRTQAAVIALRAGLVD
ncbi:response regulator transcription factor [Floridanema aerugineum]|jgi:DNA-binding NarL/FixJ family response regulator|uniref:Response regulator transcription factor n=1 Tax=Floridaenema aerugineum BLCC-F46 TaxID=3153654 RepID=A0ABV4WZV0_9CYAN